MTYSDNEKKRATARQTLFRKPQLVHSATTELVEMSNVELHKHGVGYEDVTPLENELLHRLEAYIEIYGDYTSNADDSRS
mgnify:CR=1 FL=1|tara:strand:+ start:90 stop:329 length:240 start_codon:yes stop_codon:yes gene_type:complete